MIWWLKLAHNKWLYPEIDIFCDFGVWASHLSFTWNRPAFTMFSLHHHEAGCKCAPLSVSPSVPSLLPQRHLLCGDVEGGGDKKEWLAEGGDLHGLLYFSIVLLLWLRQSPTRELRLTPSFLFSRHSIQSARVISTHHLTQNIFFGGGGGAGNLCNEYILN